MTPLIAKVAPFRLNHIMSRNRFDSILSALRFTNREEPYSGSKLPPIGTFVRSHPHMAPLY